tara:strand:- start:218 stop:487 length:270 start_codon:yes stop_codon:yes gene_type:complete
MSGTRFLKFVRLVGISRHGKCRIAQHGCDWLVEVDGMFKGQPAWLLKSLQKTEGPATKKNFDGRWVLKNNDPNFAVQWEWQHSVTAPNV